MLSSSSLSPTGTWRCPNMFYFILYFLPNSEKIRGRTVYFYVLFLFLLSLYLVMYAASKEPFNLLGKEESIKLLILPIFVYAEFVYLLSFLLFSYKKRFTSTIALLAATLVFYYLVAARSFKVLVPHEDLFLRYSAGLKIE